MKIMSYMKTFRDMGTVKTQYSNMTQNLANKGETMVFVGYSLNHGSNVYKMYNLKTNNISTSRDIVWLNMNYGKWEKILI